PNVTFEIHKFEYNGEQKIRYDGKEYLILRTFSKNNEILELVCQAYDDVRTNLAKLRDIVEIWHNELSENSMGEMSPTPVQLHRSGSARVQRRRKQ
ncbi:hypothetical protein ACHHV8_00005, partial [Paenibacillus sp. TAB 01]